MEAEFTHLMNVLDRYGDYIMTRYQTYAPEASGHLVQNVTFQVDVQGNKYMVVLNLPAYAKYVEHGRKAGKMPPVSSILDWIKTKPVMPREVDGKLPTEKQLAFLIARSIGENGTEGQHVLERASDDAQNEMLESVLNAFAEDLMEDMDKVLFFLR